MTSPSTSSPSTSPQPPLLTREFLLLVLGHFLQALGFSSMLLLPLYLEHLGADRGEIGSLMALAALGGLLSRPLAGWALDRYGRKPTVLCGTLLLVTSMALLSRVESLGWLILVDRLLLGVATGTLFTGYFTWASDLIPAQRRTEGIALFGVSGLLPIGLNAFVGSMNLPPERLPTLFLALGALIALSLLAVLPLPETLAPEERASQGEGGVALRSLLARRLAPVWLATSIFAGLVGLFFAFATVTAKARGIPSPPSLWLSYSLGAVGVRLLGGRLPDQVGPHNLVAPALGLYVLALLVCARGETREAFLLAGLLGGLAHGYCFPVLVGQVVERSPARYRGSAMAAFTALWQASELVLPPPAGRFADAHSDAAMYLLAAGAAVAGLAAWAALEGRFGAEASSLASPAAAPSLAGGPK